MTEKNLADAHLIKAKGKQAEHQEQHVNIPLMKKLDDEPGNFD